HVDVIDAVEQADRDFPADQIGSAADRAVGAYQERGVVGRRVVDVDTGGEEHQIEAVAARHHGLIDGAAADLGAAAEHRLDRHCALRHVGPGHRQVFGGKI